MHVGSPRLQARIGHANAGPAPERDGWPAGSGVSCLGGREQEADVAGWWKRWVGRHVNALSFWTVLTLVALALVLAAWLLAPAMREPSPAQRSSPPASSP
jgi:hypothetical protein